MPERGNAGFSLVGAGAVGITPAGYSRPSAAAACVERADRLLETVFGHSLGPHEDVMVAHTADGESAELFVVADLRGLHPQQVSVEVCNGDLIIRREPGRTTSGMAAADGNARSWLFKRRLHIGTLDLVASESGGHDFVTMWLRGTGAVSPPHARKGLGRSAPGRATQSALTTCRRHDRR